MIPRNYSGDSGGPAAWQELETGVATISAFAELCRRAMIAPPENVDSDELSDEAKAILVCGGQRGVIDIRASKDDFDSVERFLAVCVETEPDSRMLFLQRNDPVKTVAFLDGFGELCRLGLVLHHLGRDFSFSKTGYDLSKRLVENGESETIGVLLEFATKLDH